jgi:DNA polymerase-3 subunit delta'
VPDPFAAVVGHPVPRALLSGQLASGRLSHAYLFVGERQLGKTTMARALAAALLPEAPLERHPDYWEDDRADGLRMDEVRLIPDKPPLHHPQSLLEFLSLKPTLGSLRVAVVSEVGRLADQSQGILLKPLEEPHPGRLIVLTTPSTNPFVVLPTVVSRCQRVSFQPVPEPEIAALLRRRGVPEERARELAAVARGRPGWALRAAADGAVVDLHRHWARRLEELFGGPADQALGLAAELDQASSQWRRAARGEETEPAERVDEDPVQLALGAWQLLLRRRMLEDPGGAWARLLELSFDTLGYLEQNVSPRLALECFLLECRRA